MLKSGFKIIPIYGIRTNKHNRVCACDQADKCHTAGKHPITRHGVMDATGNQHIIKNWIKKYPDCNWAIATGEISGVTVLDVDFGSGGSESLSYFSSEVSDAIQNAPKVKTGNGFHAYFLWQPGVKNKVGLFSGIDVRNDGGYVLISPSIHYNGKQYKWLAKAGAKISLMPTSLADLMLEKSSNMSDEFDDCEAMIPTGRRNAALFYFGSSMRARGLSRRAIKAALTEENQLKCSPPLNDWELNLIVESVGKYEAGDNGMGFRW
jgi:putative DNA primase/helicase